MAASTYDAALARVLAHEGGYTNHPLDPGGPTNFGITIYDYRRYVKPDATAFDVASMKLSDAKAIYRAKYWDAMQLDRLEPGVDYAVFDYDVNSGVGRAGKVLRRLTGLSDLSSEVTDEVIAAACALPAADLVAALCDERLAFLHSLRTWPVFGNGWGRRVVEVRCYALAIAQDLPIIGAPSIAPAPGRALPDNHDQIRRLQCSLNLRGFEAGALDGDLGPQTVRAFQQSRHLHVDGIEGPQTRPLLDAAIAAA